ncbi:MAG: S-adenosylmethionine:tRNA ribosyltransferase-isomerase, partial [Acidobacteriota bacterium]
SGPSSSRSFVISSAPRRALDAVDPPPVFHCHGIPETLRLEQAGSAALRSGTIEGGRGRTHLFIYPGYSFRVIGGLLTNFHLPQSSLLMLVAAFSGRDLALSAYRHAVEERYRFYSYGDCMLII